MSARERDGAPPAAATYRAEQGGGTEKEGDHLADLADDAAAAPVAEMDGHAARGSDDGGDVPAAGEGPLRRRAPPTDWHD